MTDATNGGPAREPADPLTRLALDLHWSSNHSAGEVAKKLDPALWEITANPWLNLHREGRTSIRPGARHQARRDVRQR
jgi:hypothetical protein